MFRFPQFTLYFSILMLFSFSFAEDSFSKEVIRVGLEEASPLIVADGSGILNKILSEVEQKSPYKFVFEYMTYGRALKELKSGNVDLVGITPTGNETKEFYHYADDLDWFFQTFNIVFVREEDKDKSLKEFQLIGTQPGNEVFMSEMMNLSKDKFHGGSLDSLFRMLEKKRLDAVIFESISSITTLEKMNLKKMSYKKLNRMQGGFSVSKKRKNLRENLNRIFKEVDTDKYFASVHKLQHLKDIPSLKIEVGGL